MSPKATVAIVDDDAAIRAALLAFLEVKGFAAPVFETAEAFLGDAPETASCVVADVRMPGMSGIDLQRELRLRRINAPVVIITGHADVPMAVAALKAGAADFLEKPFDTEILLAAIEDALRGAAAPAARPNQAEDSARLAALTPREREVMNLVVARQPNKVIAHRLDIAVRTVEIHRARVMEKTGARHLSELVRLAIRLGETP